MKHLATFLFALVLAAPVSIPALADTYTYTYTGNPYNVEAIAPYFNSSEFVSGSLTLSSPLAANMAGTSVTPIQFSFSDGYQTITDVPSSFDAFTFSTDSAGNITNWTIAVYDSPSSNHIETDTAGVPQDFGFVYGPDSLMAYGETLSDPGTWTMTDNPSPAAAPEPSSLLLLGTSLLGTAGILRRRLTA